MEIKSTIRKLAYGPLRGLFSVLHRIITCAEYGILKLAWTLSGAKKPDRQAAVLMRENVTFIYKSFERQHLAKKLYRNIQEYYPGVKVVIADDSSKPLDLKGEHVEVIQLPFNSGLSYGLNRALERVETPYVIRMDDDQLLTPYTQFDRHLRYLMTHPQIDLVSVLQYSAPRLVPLDKVVKECYDEPIDFAPRLLKIPHMSQIDGYVVVGKGSNVFIVSTEKLKRIGYDDRIRMVDHLEFFYRAAGRLVSVVDPKAFVFHDHNQFRRRYQKYRSDIRADQQYISKKIRADRLAGMEAYIESIKEAKGNGEKTI